MQCLVKTSSIAFNVISHDHESKMLRPTRDRIETTHHIALPDRSHHRYDVFDHKSKYKRTQKIEEYHFSIHNHVRGNIVEARCIGEYYIRYSADFEQGSRNGDAVQRSLRRKRTSIHDKTPQYKIFYVGMRHFHTQAKSIHTSMAERSYPILHESHHVFSNVHSFSRVDSL